MANRVSAAEKIAAMSLYGDRRRRTAVIRLDRSITGLGVVRRADVLEMLDKAVRRQSVEAVGQLQNNSTWEVLFRDIETKMQFERQEHLVNERPTHVIDLLPPTRKIRLLRVPTCVPNEFLVSRLQALGVAVRSLTNEISKEDGLMSNVRVGTIECKDVNAVPDVMQWSLDGLSGTALVFVFGRPPKCYRCGDRTHKVAQCIAPRSYAASAARVEADDVENYEEAEMEIQMPTTASYQANKIIQSDTVFVADVGDQQSPMEHSRSMGGRSWEHQMAAEESNLGLQQGEQPTSDLDTGGDISDGDHDGDDESVGMKDAKSADNEGFIKPTSHERRHRRAKRAAELKSTRDSDPDYIPEGDTKRLCNSKSGSAIIQVDPTAGRSHSRTRVCSGRRGSSSAAAATS